MEYESDDCVASGILIGLCAAALSGALVGAVAGASILLAMVAP
jgi:hypothetical protein